MEKIEIPFYYINLEKDIKRRESMEEQLSRYVKNYSRVEGLLGSDFVNELNKEEFNLKNQKYNIKFNKNNIPGFGCLLSHLKIYDTIKDKTGIFCICEDDLSFELLKDPKKHFDKVVKNAPDNWEIIKLHTSSNIVLNYLLGKKELFVCNDEIDKNVMFDSNSSTLIYLVNDKFLKKFLSKIKISEVITLTEGNTTIDGLIGRYFKLYNYSIPLFKTKENLEKNYFGITSNKIINNFFLTNKELYN